MRLFPSRRPSAAFVISCLALFVALSGSAVALQGVNRVKSDDIAPGAVRRSDVAANAISGANVEDDSLAGSDIEEGTLAGGTPTGPAGGDLSGAYPNPRVAANAIGSGQIINGAVRAPDFASITTVQSTSASFPQGVTGSAFIQCPAGTRVIYGGGLTSAAGGLTVLNRRSDPNGWRYDAYNSDINPTTVTVFAYCLGG